jgi:hypothetical protein
MGLYISHLDTITIKADRSLYIYLLDYGWPGGNWEQIFKRHFMHMADLATETRAVVIGSMRGIHFGNEVLNWHQVGDLSAEDVLPGLLITKTDPSYFKESNDDSAPIEPGLGDLLVVPLKPFCHDETTFLAAIEGVFADLRNGLALRNFQIARHDPRRHQARDIGRRLVNAMEVKPGAFGVSIDLKALLLPPDERTSG